MTTLKIGGIWILWLSSIQHADLYCIRLTVVVVSRGPHLSSTAVLISAHIFGSYFGPCVIHWMSGLSHVQEIRICQALFTRWNKNIDWQAECGCCRMCTFSTQPVWCQEYQMFDFQIVLSMWTVRCNSVIELLLHWQWEVWVQKGLISIL
jgi:hypothetical protein